MTTLTELEELQGQEKLVLHSHWFPKDEIPRFNNIKKSNRGIVEKKVPTLGEINEIKNNLILKKVKDSRDNLDEYIKIIKKNEDNEFGSLELAAGLLKMIREN